MAIQITAYDELQAYAAALVEDIERAGRGEHATVIGLIGELGAGKTALAQCIAEVLGVTEPVTSPTFVIEKRYRLEGSAFARLVHIDAYRLEGPEDLASIDWRETCADPANLVLVEWADVVHDALPKDARRIELVLSRDGTRTITPKHHGE